MGSQIARSGRILTSRAQALCSAFRSCSRYNSAQISLVAEARAAFSLLVLGDAAGDGTALG